MKNSLLVSMLALLVGTVGCTADTVEETATTQSGISDISQEEFLSNPPEGVLILDVRTSREFNAGHVPNAINIPHDELASRVGELKTDPTAPVVVYCERGKRAGIAANLLADAGYTRILHLEGDMEQWRANDRPTEE